MGFIVEDGGNPIIDSTERKMVQICEPPNKKKRWSLLEDLKLMMIVDYISPVEWYKLSPYFANRTEV